MNQGQNGLAFFNRATADGRRGGAFYVNNHNLKAMTRDIVATITLHEASPGEILNYNLDCQKCNKYLTPLVVLQVGFKNMAKVS